MYIPPPATYANTIHNTKWIDIKHLSNHIYIYIYISIYILLVMELQILTLVYTI